MGVPQELRILQPPNYQSNKSIIINGYKLSQSFWRLKYLIEYENVLLDEIKQKFLNDLIPNWQNKIFTSEYGLFYVRFKQFIEEKDKNYDLIGTPKHLRNYNIPQNTKIKDYNLGIQLRSIKNGTKIPKILDDYLSDLDPNWWKKRNKHGKIVENGKTKEETLKYIEDEEDLSKQSQPQQAKSAKRYTQTTKQA